MTGRSQPLDSPLGLHPAPRKQQSHHLEGPDCTTQNQSLYPDRICTDVPHHMHLRSSPSICNLHKMKKRPQIKTPNYLYSCMSPQCAYIFYVIPVCIHICIYTYIYIYIIHVYIHIYTCIYIYHTCVHTNLYIYMHAYVYIKLYVYIQLYAYNPLYIRNSVYAHVYIYICLFIYLYNMVYIHIYAQTQHWVYTTNPNPPARTTPSPASLPPPGDYLNPLLPGVGGTGAPAPFI